MKELIVEYKEIVLGFLGSLVAFLAWLKSIKIKVNKICLKFEQISDDELLDKFNDNPNSKNKENYSKHEIANVLRKRLVINEVMSSVVSAPEWLIHFYIKKFCCLNRMKPKIIYGVPKETVIEKTFDYKIEEETIFEKRQRLLKEEEEFHQKRIDKINNM